MANWNLPTVNSNYLDFVSEVNSKFLDCVILGGGMPNPPNQTFRFNRGANTFEEWNSSGFWALKAISLQSGGTGGNNAAQARVNLGIGSMGVQNSNAVNITGGSITGVAYSASDITTGIMPLARGGTGKSLAITPFGTTFVSDGSQLLLVSGVNITELNASSLVLGTVPAARLSGVAILSGSNNFTGVNVFSGAIGPQAPIVATGGFPAYQLFNPNSAVDFQYYRMGTINGVFYIQRVDSAYTTGYTIMSIDGNGIVNCFGGSITNLNADNITDGIINPARLGSGVANSTTFLRGDGTWQVVTSGTPGETIPSGLIALFDTNCPAGWTRVAALDNRFPIGGTTYGASGGSTSHQHSIGLNTSIDGKHDHNFSESGITGVNDSSFNSLAGKEAISITIPSDGHRHSFSISGRTDQNGDHSHQVSGNVSTVDQYPPYLTVVYCRKN